MSSAASRCRTCDREARFQRCRRAPVDTLASSLSVALENARLVDETRQRAAELAIVNEIGQATASPARPRAADRAGRRPDGAPRSRPTSSTSRSTIRAPASSSSRTTSRTGERAAGLAAVGRGADLEDHPVAPAATPEPGRRDLDEIGTHGVGTDARSYLGVPIIVGDDAIGAISVQSVTRRALRRSRRTPADHARGEHRHRHPERPALRRVAAARHRDGDAGRGRPRDLRDTRPSTVLQRIVEHAHDAARRRLGGRVPARRRRPDLPRHRRRRQHRRPGPGA